MPKWVKIAAEFLLLIISVWCMVVFYAIFLAYGIYMSFRKWELLSYLRGVNVSNDKTLNVAGKYALNQSMSENPVFGNHLHTVSKAMCEGRLHKFGKFWNWFLNKLDKDHIKKAHDKHVADITAEYERLKNITNL
jgi:ABC-type sugar transport system permease subunit